MPDLPHYSEHELVDFDIEEIVEFIAVSNLPAAKGVLEAIRDRLRRIRQAPLEARRYRPQSFSNDHLHYALCHPYKQFLVFFEYRNNEIRVLYVHRGTRNFEGIHRRERRR